MPYTPTIWVDGQEPAINADNLNKLEQGVADASQPVSYNDLTNKPTLLQIGTTATTAKAGNYVPTWSEITGKPTTFAPIIGKTATTAMAGNTVIPEQATWANISGKPAVIAAGADAAAARAAIGAGTSSLALGTTATTAAAGNHNHAVTADAASGLEAAATIQALAVALSARIKALEDAATAP